MGSELVRKISLKIYREIAMLDWPFTEGKFINKCLLIVASELWLEKKGLCNNIGLLQLTMQWKTSDISNNYHDQLQNNFKSWMEIISNETEFIQFSTFKHDFTHVSMRMRNILLKTIYMWERLLQMTSNDWMRSSKVDWQCLVRINCSSN
jgi:hypothetical protein